MGLYVSSGGGAGGPPTIGQIRIPVRNSDFGTPIELSNAAPAGSYCTFTMRVDGAEGAPGWDGDPTLVISTKTVPGGITAPIVSAGATDLTTAGVTVLPGEYAIGTQKLIAFFDGTPGTPRTGALFIDWAIPASNFPA